MMVTLFLTGVVCAELAVALGPRRTSRQRLWKAAQERARATGKTLLVVGAPRNGVINFFFPDYGCGDVCVDMQGCPGCAAHVTAPVEEVMPHLEDDSVVVFVSCVLEYVGDLPAIARDLERIAGRDLFVARVEPQSMTSWAYPGAKWILYSAPEGNAEAWRWARR